MRAITVIQPWAWLLASGQKKFETRSWQTNARSLFVIHASKRTKVSDEAFQALFSAAPELFTAHGIASADDLAYGAAVGAARLVDCRSTNGLWMPSPLERALGDFSSNRFAWDFREAYLLPNPIPYRGQQAVWEFPDTLFYAAVPA